MTYEFEEVALHTVARFRHERALNFSATQGSCKSPAASSTVFSTINSVCSFLNRRRTHAQFFCFLAERLTTALLEFPTVHFAQVRLPKPRTANTTLMHLGVSLCHTHYIEKDRGEGRYWGFPQPKHVEKSWRVYLERIRNSMQKPIEGLLALCFAALHKRGL